LCVAEFGLNRAQTCDGFLCLAAHGGQQLLIENFRTLGECFVFGAHGLVHGLQLAAFVLALETRAALHGLFLGEPPVLAFGAEHRQVERDHGGRHVGPLGAVCHRAAQAIGEIEHPGRLVVLARHIHFETRAFQHGLAGEPLGMTRGVELRCRHRQHRQCSWQG